MFGLGNIVPTAAPYVLRGLATIGGMAVGVTFIDQVGKTMVAIKKGSYTAWGHAAQALAAPLVTPFSLIGLAGHRIGATYLSLTGDKTEEEQIEAERQADIEKRAQELAKESAAV